MDEAWRLERALRGTRLATEEEEAEWVTDKIHELLALRRHSDIDGESR